MPLGGQDKQYDETWVEQDKVRRRQELKRRLKTESIYRIYNPFFHMSDTPAIDPAIDRYMDLRKKGRMPNAPFNPKFFFTCCCFVLLPIGLSTWLTIIERKPYLEAMSKGEYPMEKIMYRDQSH